MNDLEKGIGVAMGLGLITLFIYLMGVAANGF